VQRRVRRALLTVSDKAHIVPLARTLAAHGVEIFSTGNTRAALLAEGLTVLDISALTGRAEAFGGRMKTLSFEVASALLFDRDRDADEAATLDIAPIDLVAVNLYPFEAQRDQGLPLERLIEHIDIGGPTLLRAAAKNFRHVVALSHPADYAAVCAELDATGGCTTLDTRLRLMRRAFEVTRAYDTAIAAHLAHLEGAPTRTLTFGPAAPLRYGENPHQPAQLYPGAGPSPLDRVLGGKALSYNNLLDIEAALGAVRGHDAQGAAAVAVVKHGNPCGLAVASTSEAALELAWAGDPVSAFGSVIAFSRPVDADALAPLALDAPDRAARRFVEVLVAPTFSEAARALAANNKNLRLVELSATELEASTERRLVLGHLLEQSADDTLFDRLDVVAGQVELDPALCAFGVRAARQLKSNAVALVRRVDATSMQLVGMGAGQPNRVNSARLAVERARETLGLAAGGAQPDLAACYAVSDAFLPFRDTLDVLADAGVRVLLQPGGSLRDAEVVAAGGERGVAVVLTGTRHFRH
jgi:phosphoribosylaminoimidazolecarboxamide formyltransferase/IMP cyclohydrolase